MAGKIAETGGSTTPSHRPSGASPKSGNAPVEADRRPGDPTRTLPGAKLTNKEYGPGPVTVYIEPKVEKAPVLLAIQKWNTTMGTNLFQVAKDPKSADIRVTLKKVKAGITSVDTGTPGAWTPNGQGVITLDPGMFSHDGWKNWLDIHAANAAQVDNYAITPGVFLDAGAANIEHELGHTIGLAHPGKPGSMTQYGTPPDSGLMGGATAPLQNEYDKVMQLRNPTEQPDLHELQHARMEDIMAPVPFQGSGRTPEPQIKQGKGPEALPWGEAAQVNDAIGLIPPPDENNFTPQGDAESFLFSPTDRPNEPVTAGQPYGAGPAAMAGQHESDDQFVARIAAQVKQDPAAPKSLRQFAERALNGM